jgi:hypothetical protein
LLLDPWSPDYEAPIQTDGPDIATAGQIDPSVETADWKAVRPAATVPPKRICFVDGVRRVEARVLAQDDGKLIHGLFSSAGAGCVVSEGGKAAYDRIKISRYLILGAGRQKTESIAAGTQIIEFKGVASPGDTPDDLMNCLQNLMRTDEVALAEGFLGAGTYVFADGPLNFFSAATDPLVGVIKRIYLPYLDAPHFALVSQLQRGERTPLFSIRDGKYDRYSGAARVGHLIRGKIEDPARHRIDWKNKQITVVDIHNLHDRAKRFVIGVMLKRMFEDKEKTGTAQPLVFVVLDELNKYAPREGWSPIKDVILDMAERGRSLGVILIGAQQTASQIERRVVANSSFRVVGRLDTAEAQHGEYGFLPASTRLRASILKPGTMIVSQPEIPIPLLVQFPFPAWATRPSEAVTTMTAGSGIKDPFAKFK